MTNKYMYFVANWKMFGDLRSLNSLDKVIKFSKNNKKNKLKIVYCPPNTLIRPLSRRLKKTKIEVEEPQVKETVMEKELPIETPKDTWDIKDRLYLLNNQYNDSLVNK